MNDVSMGYPRPRRYRELITAPFTPRGRKEALRGVSLELAAGERIAFLGPNGAGKTTLLKLVAGLLLPTQGRVVVGGFDTLRDNDGVRRRCALVMNEERSFYWRLSGEENLEFYGALQNLFGESLRKRIAEVLDLVGLTDSADAQVGGYSAGMKQRLSIARALLVDAPVLILDEPTRALDPQGAEELHALVLETLHRDLKKTLLIATHRLEETRLLCDRLVILNNGRITMDESLAAIDGRGMDLMDFYRSGVSG